MNNKQIENRIRELTAERQSLESAHNAMVQQNQKFNQEFQQQVAQNQSRFAQITGAITELQKLMDDLNQGNSRHEDGIPDPSDRVLKVSI